jgi:hypothetical protein
MFRFNKRPLPFGYPEQSLPGLPHHEVQSFFSFLDFPFSFLSAPLLYSFYGILHNRAIPTHPGWDRPVRNACDGHHLNRKDR